MEQSPKTNQGGASLSSKVQPSSVKTVQLHGLNPQLDNGGANSHTCPPQTTHAIPHRFNALATKKKKKKKSGMESPDWHVPKTMSDIHLSKTLALDMPDMTKQIDGQATQPSQVAWKISSVEELETLPAGTKSRTSHHQSHEAERGRKRGKEAWWSSLKGWERDIINPMKTGIVSIWQRIKGNIGEFSERWGGAHSILNWTELNNTKIVPSKRLNLLKVGWLNKIKKRNDDRVTGVLQCKCGPVSSDTCWETVTGELGVLRCECGLMSPDTYWANVLLLGTNGVLL